MTLLEAVKSTAMKTKSIAGLKSASSENSSDAKKSLDSVTSTSKVQLSLLSLNLKIQRKSQTPKNHINSIYVLASGVIKKQLPMWPLIDIMQIIRLFSQIGTS